MKICIVVFANIGEESGSSLRARYVYEFLKQEGYNVRILAPSNSKSSVDTASGLPSFAKKLLFPAYLLKWKLKIFKELAFSKYDLIFSIGDFRGFPTIHFASKFRGFKTLFEAQAIMSEEAKNLDYSEKETAKCKELEEFCIKNADFATAVSENICDFYKKINSDIKLMPVCNFNINLFRQNKEAKEKIRLKYGISKNEKLIGLVGPFRLAYNKYGIEFLHKNIDLFDKRLRFLVIGQCGDKIENERLAYTGYLDSRQDYAEHIAALDALIVPSRIATSGPLTKMLEAMACSIPIFITPPALDGLTHAKPDENLLVFSENSFVSKTNKLIFADWKMKQIGNFARKTVEALYDAPAKEKLRELFAEVKYGL